MKRVASSVLLSLGLIVLASTQVRAQTLGMTPEGYLGYGLGYGGSSWTTFTTSINSAFGGPGNVISIPDLSGNLSGYSSLFVNLRNYGDAFSTAEATNLAAFIASGRRAMIIGENEGWLGWDNSILSQFGASSHGSCYYSTSATVVNNALTAGVSSVFPPCAGDGEGGGAVSLFADPFALLFGAQQNALVLLDVNLCDDSYISDADNARFCTNAANWLAASTTPGNVTPEPVTIVTLGTGLVGLFVVGRRRRSGTA